MSSFALALVGLIIVIFCPRFLGQRPKRRTIRSRRSLDPSNAQTGIPPLITIFDFTTPNIILTFNQPIVLNGIPQYETNTGKLPTSATLTTPNVVTLAYDTPGSVTAITIPFQDPAIKSRTGGSVSPGTFPTT